MSLSSASRPRDPGGAPGPVAAPARWAARAEAAGPEIAVLITACDDVATAVRGFRTMLPRAQVFLYGDALSPGAVAEAEAAGASVRLVAWTGRDALVRRMLAEVDADIYILAHGTDGSDVCVARLLVAEVDGAEMDLVTVSRWGGGPACDAGDRLLSRIVDFLYGRGGDALSSDFKACSRRFAKSYTATRNRDGDSRFGPAVSLTLHALRLRMPVGGTTALGGGTLSSVPVPTRDLAGWVALIALVGRLLVEERPRRVFGLVGLAIVAAGIVTALPHLRIHDGGATLPRGPAALVSLALTTAGAAVGVAGLMLDTLAKARQEVRRVGYLAIPRRAERG